MQANTGAILLIGGTLPESRTGLYALDNPHILA